MASFRGRGTIHKPSVHEVGRLGTAFLAVGSSQRSWRVQLRRQARPVLCFARLFMGCELLAVHPSGLMYTRVFLTLEPLGLELVAGAARAAGHDVRIVDLQVESPHRMWWQIDRWRPD